MMKNKNQRRRGRRASKRQRTAWWRSAQVLARRDPAGPYGPSNCYWRLARSEHEAIIGIEEWDPAEPVELPMSPEHFVQRSHLATESERRHFDVWLRMHYRCGSIELPEEAEAVWVTSTPLRVGVAAEGGVN